MKIAGSNENSKVERMKQGEKEERGFKGWRVKKQCVLEYIIGALNRSGFKRTSGGLARCVLSTMKCNEEK